MDRSHSEIASNWFETKCKLTRIVTEGQQNMKKPRYMILKGGSPAIHKLGDISREEDELIYVKSETQNHFIGIFVEGFGFAEVEFRKSDCRPLTPSEIEKLNNREIQLGGISNKMHSDLEVYPDQD